MREGVQAPGLPVQPSEVHLQQGAEVLLLGLRVFDQVLARAEEALAEARRGGARRRDGQLHPAGGPAPVN